MHWAKASRIDRMKFARACSDPERRAEWVAIARKYHRIYLRDKRDHAKHLTWMGEKEAQNFAAMLRRDTTGQAVAELFGEFVALMVDTYPQDSGLTVGMRSLLELEEEAFTCR